MSYKNLSSFLRAKDAEDTSVADSVTQQFTSIFPR